MLVPRTVLTTLLYKTFLWNIGGHDGVKKSAFGCLRLDVYDIMIVGHSKCDCPPPTSLLTTCVMSSSIILIIGTIPLLARKCLTSRLF